jgi:hypothetical protein
MPTADLDGARVIRGPGTEWRRRARHALFGPRPLAPRIILTPFAALLETATRTQRPGGWWRSGDGEDVTVVQVPQGSASADAVLCLEDGIEITFVGACGLLALDREAAVGTIVEAATARAFDGTVGHRTWSGSLAAPPVTVATVRCLADSSTRHHQLTATAVVVDLETAWILSAGHTAGCPTRALLAVTDTNLDGAVFDTDFPTVLTQLHQALALAQTSG